MNGSNNWADFVTQAAEILQIVVNGEQNRENQRSALLWSAIRNPCHASAMRAARKRQCDENFDRAMKFFSTTPLLSDDSLRTDIINELFEIGAGTKSCQDLVKFLGASPTQQDLHRYFSE
ncbi:MAG: hypothetical protein ABL898_05290 [Hyphomicrobiaceae bacterium]